MKTEKYIKKESDKSDPTSPCNTCEYKNNKALSQSPCYQFKGNGTADGCKFAQAGTVVDYSLPEVEK